MIGQSPEPWWVDGLKYGLAAGAGLVVCGLLLMVFTGRRRVAAALCLIGLVAVIGIMLASKPLVTNCRLNPRVCE